MAEETERILILMEAKAAQLSREMDRARRDVRRATDEIQKSTNRMDRQISTNARSTAASFANLGRAGVAAIGVLVASLAGGEMRNAIANLADLKDTADRLGFDVEQYQALERGLSLAGVNAAAAANAMEIFSQRIGEAALGEGSFLETLQRANIAIRDQAGDVRPTMDILRDYADLIASYPDQARQIALANDAFGRGGRALALALSEGGASIDTMITSAREGGYVLDEEIINRAAVLDDKFEDLQRKASNMFRTFAVGAGEGVAGLADIVSRIASIADGVNNLDLILAQKPKAAALLGIGTVEALDNGTASEDQVIAAQRILSAYEGLQAQAEETVMTLDRMAAEAAAMEEIVKGLTLTRLARDLDAASKGLEAGTISAGEFEQRLTDITAEALAMLLELDAIEDITFDGAIAQIGRLALSLFDAATQARTLRQNLPGATASAARRQSQEDRLNNIDVRPAQPFVLAPGRPEARPNDIDFGYAGAPSGGSSPGGGGGSPRESELERAMQSAREEIAKLQAESVELLAVAASGRNVGDALEYARKRAELLYAAQQDGREITPELRAEIGALALSYTTAGQAAEDAADRLQLMADHAETGADAMSSLFFGIVSGASSAEDALASLLMKIAEVQMQNAFIGASQSGGWMGSIFSALGGAMTPIGQNANGTDYWRGGPTWVGERGPEIVDLPRGARVFDAPTSRKMTEGGGGGGTVDVRVSMDDTGNLRVFVENVAGNVTARAINANNRALPDMIRMSRKDPRKKP